MRAIAGPAAAAGIDQQVRSAKMFEVHLSGPYVAPEVISKITGGPEPPAGVTLAPIDPRTGDRHQPPTTEPAHEESPK
jgi:hypothetical protein